MALGNLSIDILTRVAAARGVNSIDGSSSPTRTEAIAWINEGVKDVHRRLLPRRINVDDKTPGRLDKLLKTTGLHSPTGSAGFASFAVTNTVHYLAITLGADRYPMREISLGELWDIESGAFTPTVDKATYAWGASAAAQGIFYLPAAETVIARFTVDQPALMVYNDPGDGEDFPLDLDLMPLVANYAIARMWLAQERNVPLGQMFWQLYEAGITAMVGSSSIRPETAE